MSNVDAVLLRELLASANPLPWSVWCGDGGKPLDFGGVTVVRDAEGGVVAKFNRDMTTNLVFISDRNDRLACGAVNALPVLLDELAALQSRLAAAEAEAARASGLLQRWFDDDESYEAYRALVDETLAHLASRPEGEAADGR